MGAPGPGPACPLQGPAPLQLRPGNTFFLSLDCSVGLSAGKASPRLLITCQTPIPILTSIPTPTPVPSPSPRTHLGAPQHRRPRSRGPHSPIPNCFWGAAPRGEPGAALHPPGIPGPCRRGGDAHRAQKETEAGAKRAVISGPRLSRDLPVAGNRDRQRGQQAERRPTAGNVRTHVPRRCPAEPPRSRSGTPSLARAAGFPPAWIFPR